MRKAAERCQIVVVSHACTLVDALAERPETTMVAPEEQLGETVVRNAQPPRWMWPTR